MKIAGISGSLRKQSFNTLLLQQASRYLPKTTEFELLSLSELPLYNEDLEQHSGPVSIQSIKTKVEQSDGLLIASPEYNHTVSGVLQNAIDWLSRPAFQSPLAGKPVALLSASMSPIGGARAQAHLKQIFAATLSPLFPSIEYLLGNAHHAFNEQGKMTNIDAERRLKRFIEHYVDWLQNNVASSNDH